MEMTSSVMRFALATYFMKRGGLSSVFSAASCPSPSYEPSFTTSQLSDDEEKEIIDSSFSHVVSTHVSNLRELLVEQRFQDWSKGIAELREYVAANNQIDLLVAVLVKMIQRQEEDAVCIVQGNNASCSFQSVSGLSVRVVEVIEHMCFEDDGEPSVVFDQVRYNV
ncbi:unnamed protein product [Phytophthora lilii]|uniref:Unnamed protein product n=1 Tax=Phytophthora lilii TaxID=2077276 RepID=A0A9W6WP02_9STRA|nr:unnamed protein product [Phytophthora lilii]